MSSSRPASADLPPDLDALSGDFELLRELGRGAMTIVMLGRERATGRLVAIKAIRRRFLGDEDTTRRFAREARVVAALEHPGIVTLYGVRRLADDAIAIIMRYIEGPTLRQALVDHGRFDVASAHRVLADIGDALAYAHRRGFVHRDVKPENIFLEVGTGRAVLSDFGIARAVDEDPGLTRAGMVVGTPTYMSPEQIDGLPLDGRSDLYSLGIVGWEMLTGERPWAGANLYNVIYKHKHEPLAPLREVRRDVPRHVRAAIEGAMRKRLEERWPTADAFLEKLGPAPILRPPAPPPTEAPPLLPDESASPGRSRGARRWRIGAGITGAVLISLLAFDRERARREATVVAAAESLTVQTSPAVSDAPGGGPTPSETPASSPPPAHAGRSDTLARAPAAPSTPPASGGVAQCESPRAADQRACLLARIDENDVELTRVYQQLIARLRDESGEREPEAVRALRAEQRVWLADRDRACRERIGSVPNGRWALPLAECMAAVSATRADELRARLTGSVAP